jgi:transposase
MEPTAAQGSGLGRTAGARRWVWNWALRRWKDHYAATGKSISLKQLSAELTALKQQSGTAWLNEVDSQALQQVLKDLYRAFVNFFEKRARYPRFRSRKRDKARFRIPQRVKIEDGKVYIPKVGWVRIRQSRDVDGTIKGATFKREADGHWYVSLRTKLAKSFSDAAMGEFRRQLEYKCLWNRRTLVVIDRFFPSSKMCNRCSALNDRLTLSDREWDCDCGAHHKRDFLAACNIRDEGLRILAAGQAERLNAQGASVSPGPAGQLASN